jgi:hypothetical protein
MTDYIDVKYILLYSTNLDRFKDKGNYVYNFKCTECGDSSKNKSKTRGYIYEKKGKFFYYCHNCNHSVSFQNYLKEKDYNLYTQYQKEKFGLTDDQVKQKLTTTFGFPSVLANSVSDEQIKLRTVVQAEFAKLFCMAFASLEMNKNAVVQEARSFLEKRRIRGSFYGDLYVTEDFMGFTNAMIPDKFKNPVKEPRIIIPIRDLSGEIVGYQGRSLPSYTKEQQERNPDFIEIRYITIMLDKDKPRIYGLNKVDFNFKHYVLEGPFDSMFLPNAISTCGGAILSELDKLGPQKENTVVIFDNEPRNKQICDQMHKAIIRNMKTFIWPSWIAEKDINEFYLSDPDGINLPKLIADNTFRGMQAELEFKAWRKC